MLSGGYPSTFYLLPSTFYLLPSTFYLLPSTFCLMHSLLRQIADIKKGAEAPFSQNLTTSRLLPLTPEPDPR
ncbi:hypothetical protein EAH77_07010 [Ewingella americana]|uniref:Uncharacterized protein n=1 Tax=Ewingella americana TaxID=41202 RepID=A0A502GN69_9GAMM|nr:hypothetical protein EAH77_07010 [Ewingella americana]